jgi:DNA-binding transcriptional ArsR family regulator
MPSRATGAPGDGAGDLDAACELLRALGAPHRLAIVLELSEGTRCVHELVDALGISQSLASQHLRVLRASGLVTSVRRGKETAYSLTGGHAARIARDALAHSTRPGRPHGLRPTAGRREHRS